MLYCFYTVFAKTEQIVLGILSLNEMIFYVLFNNSLYIQAGVLKHQQLITQAIN
jgi:hypothetical protein